MKYSIIGAGIGGLTTALAFEKTGINSIKIFFSSKLNCNGSFDMWMRVIIN